MQIELSIEDIKQDIEGFRNRISVAREKLTSLSTGYLSYPEHKKREKIRLGLENEIEHVRNLIKIARQALTE